MNQPARIPNPKPKIKPSAISWIKSKSGVNQQASKSTGFVTQIEQTRDSGILAVNKKAITGVESDDRCIKSVGKRDFRIWIKSLI